ncbi:DUF1549 domain-containing protein [Lignipirellula cremea]|uniref:DUF1549 domain-containing protein n=1 Tax=Lignipirellula cremea TaxID=2528010 RepID=A0A518DXQ6_9BACT|nr:DUF1549 domain-containing protein [Lignipirellula cremea]QDU96622.1 hypothetical protein Pla8534_44430 [Lignipirellula cremea]
MGAVTFSRMSRTAFAPVGNLGIWQGLRGLILLVATIAVGPAAAAEPEFVETPFEGVISELTLKDDSLLLKSYNGVGYRVFSADDTEILLEGEPAKLADLKPPLHANIWYKPTTRAYKHAVKIVAQKEKLPYLHPALQAKTPPFPADLAALPVHRSQRGDMAAMIDRHVDQRLKAAQIPSSPLADDSEFLRRVYLDITGRTPSLEQTKAFLASTDPAKRAQLIDQLLASPHFGDHFANLWRDLALYEETHRFQTKYIEPYRQWLADEYNANRGWNRMAWSQITAAGIVTEQPEGFYMLTSMQMGQTDASKIAASTSRMFLGVDIQCAQCHDHFYIDQWKHQDFWRLAAFFSHVRDEGNVGTAGQASSVAVIFEGDGVPQGKSNDRVPYYTPPQGARIEIPDPTDPAIYLETVEASYLDGPQPELEPSGPYRPVLARWMVDPQNPFFGKAAVNRLWAHFFARGLVNPVDDMHALNEPSHPEILQQLTAEFLASGTDVKHLIRCLCNSQTYQRTSRPLPENASDETLCSHMAVKVLTPDMLADSREIIIGGRLGGRDAKRYEELFINDELATQLGYGIPHYLRLMVLHADERQVPATLDDLFLKVLSRLPTDEDRKLMGDEDLNDIYHALLNSAEFIHNH